MRNIGSLFWGSLILLAGILLLVSNFVRINVWDILWPVAIIMIGGWMLFGPRLSQRNLETQTVMVPLETASDADIYLHHGAGRLSLRSTSTQDVLLSGTCVGGADVTVSKSGPSTRVDVKSRAGEWFGWPNVSGPYGYAWDLMVTPQIPVRLTLETGASETNLDLRDLKVTELQIKTGASSSVVTLPAQAGMTRVKVASGAASVKLFVPEGVAAHISIQSGLAGIHVDQSRFPAAAGGYKTSGYDTAANRADIFIETGVGSIDII